MEVMYLDFSMAFDIASQEYLISNLMKYNLGETIIMWLHNGLDHHTKRGHQWLDVELGGVFK